MPGQHALNRVIAALTLAAIALVMARPAVNAQGAPIPQEVTTVLSRVGTPSPEDITTLQADRVVVRTQVAPGDLESTVIAAVRIRSGLERTLAYFRQFIAYVDGQTTVAYSAVTQPADEADLRPLTFDSGDLADLRACQPIRCDIRVGEASIAAVQSAVDWNAPDAGERANQWLRRTLTVVANNYQRAGDAALRGYDERGATLDLPAMWSALEQRSPIPATLAPGLQRYMGSFPGTRPTEAADEFYVDKQRLTGLKPIVSLTHLITWRDPAQTQRVIVAQKQIQATHYLFGSLAVTLFVQDTATPPVTYVVYSNSARGDLLRGTQASQDTGIRGRLNNLGASVQRRLGEQMVRQSAQTLLGSMKTALER